MRKGDEGPALRTLTIPAEKSYDGCWIPMRLLSINVGRTREIASNGEIIRTAICKMPVEGTVRVRTLNLDGDQQTNLKVHGGVDKAIYVYPSEHYAFWRTELSDGYNLLADPTQGRDQYWGMFGENFTIEGLLEDAAPIGARLRVGTAEFRITQPRIPCFKLAARFSRPDIIDRFLASGRSGFYLAVEKEGDV